MLQQIHSQLRKAHVKPYCDTIVGLFSACCCCRRRLLRRSKAEYERLLDEEERETDDASVTEAPPLLRWLALLLSGHYLPSNLQLYALLHRCSGWLEGLQQPKQSQHQQAPLLAPVTAQFLQEAQLLCKDIAKWLASDDAVIGDDKERIPNGNSRHQIQRLIFHTMRCLGQDGGPVSVDTDRAMQSLPNVSVLRRAASEAAEDVRLAAFSTLHLVVALFMSPQMTSLVRDAINFTRDQAADAARAVVQKASGVESAVRPDQAERRGSLEVQIDATKASTQYAVETLAPADPTAAVASMLDRPETVIDRATEKIPSRREIAGNVGKIVGELMDSDASFRAAVQQLVSLSDKYRKAARSLSHGDPSDLLGADSKARPSVDDAFEVSGHLLEAVKALKELLEGLAGGKSLEPLLDEARIVWYSVESEALKAFDIWLDEAQSTVLTSVSDQGASQDLLQSLAKLTAVLEDIIRNRPDIHQGIDRLVELSVSFASELRREPRLLSMFQHLKALSQDLTHALMTSTSDISHRSSAIFRDMASHVLPALLHLMGDIPLPRLEYHSPEVDAALDDIRVAAVNLLPARIRLEMTESLEWNRINTNESDVRINQMRCQVSGIRLALRDVSFFVREKVTQVSSSCLNALCCALPSRGEAHTLTGEQEMGHLAAYREQALLDVDLFGEGGSLEIDLAQRKHDVQEGTNDDQGLSEDPEFHRFLNVNKVSLTLGDSFNFRLKQSRHRLINTLFVEGLGVPLVRTVVEHVGAGYIHHAVETLNMKAADFCQRAKRWALLSRGSTQYVWQDFLRVAMDFSAGKSRERLEKEKQAREEQRRQQEQEQAAESQEGATATLQPTAIIVKLSKDTSISIGAYPTLLPSYAQGPTTDRTRVRNAIVEDRWRDLATQRASRTVAELAEGFKDVSFVSHGVQKTLAEDVREVGDSRELAQGLQHVIEEREGIEEARSPEFHDEGEEETGQRWYHSGFDL